MILVLGNILQYIPVHFLNCRQKILLFSPHHFLHGCCGVYFYFFPPATRYQLHNYPSPDSLKGRHILYTDILASPLNTQVKILKDGGLEFSIGYSDPDQELYIQNFKFRRFRHRIFK
jgi:hypothetical protein